MKIEITSVSVSKKGQVWFQGKVLEHDGKPVELGEYECDKKPELEEFIVKEE